jgi:hypothetical protein
LTPLNSGTPLPLPLGWSPVAPFHFDLGGVVLSEAAELTITSRQAAREMFPHSRAVQRVAREWIALSTAAADAPAVQSDNRGSYCAFVAGRRADGSAGVHGRSATWGFSGPVPDLAGLAGQAVVQPNPALASTAAAEITAAVAVRFTGPVEVPSGIFLRTDIDEIFTLQNGNEVPGSPYDTSIFAYRGPAGGVATEVTAEFPIRPSVALGPDRLAEAVVRVRIQRPDAFSAAIAGSSGGSASLTNLRLDAHGAFAFGDCRDQKWMWPASPLLPDWPALRAFDVNLSELRPDKRSRLQSTGFRPIRIFCWRAWFKHPTNPASHRVAIAQRQ